MKKLAAVLAVILALVTCDLALWRNDYIIRSKDGFARNDFEITRLKHPETVWDRVYFGDGAVASGYVEEISTAMYINLGLEDCGITDLKKLIDGRYIRIGKELVIGLNYSVLTGGGANHRYAWRKSPIVPYVYYDRARIIECISGKNKNENQEKPLYHGSTDDVKVSGERDAERLESNLDALKSIIDYCDENKIRLRTVFLPWNGRYAKPDYMQAARSEAETLLNENNIEIYDLEDMVEPEYFYDATHMDYETGAPWFTELMDRWL